MPNCRGAKGRGARGARGNAATLGIEGGGRRWVRDGRRPRVWAEAGKARGEGLRKRETGIEDSAVLALVRRAPEGGWYI